MINITIFKNVLFYPVCESIALLAQQYCMLKQKSCERSPLTRRSLFVSVSAYSSNIHFSYDATLEDSSLCRRQGGSLGLGTEQPMYVEMPHFTAERSSST